MGLGRGERSPSKSLIVKGAHSPFLHCPDVWAFLSPAPTRMRSPFALSRDGKYALRLVKPPGLCRQSVECVAKGACSENCETRLPYWGNSCDCVSDSGFTFSQTRNPNQEGTCQSRYYPTGRRVTGQTLFLHRFRDLGSKLESKRF